MFDRPDRKVVPIPEIMRIGAERQDILLLIPLGLKCLYRTRGPEAFEHMNQVELGMLVLYHSRGDDMCTLGQPAAS